MKFERRYTVAGTPVADQIEWEVRKASIPGAGFYMPAVEVPKSWSQDATNILAQKYLRKAGVPSHTVRGHETGVPQWLWPSVPISKEMEALDGSETSAREVFHRMAGCWTYWGWREGYFRDRIDDLIDEQKEEYARIFYDELFWMLANQVAAPNSPQWFNTGLHWAYGIEGPDAGNWTILKDYPIADGGQVADVVDRVFNAYERPQVHACFLTPTADDLVNPGGIMDTWAREAKIFKQGSGSGVNVSAWRGKGEPLSGGGKASGVMSFLRIGDSAAGAIQSGGTTRRAAKMVCMDADHPEIEEFIDWKVREEAKAAAMYVGSVAISHCDAKNSDPHDVVPKAVKDRINAGFEPEVFGIGWEEEAIKTVDGQNSNNSVRVTNEFMECVEHNMDWGLTARTTGEFVKRLPSRNLWIKICRAAWASADPGLLFHTTINEWNTCATDGEIRTTNPCAEFHHLDGSACDLASLNLGKFVKTVSGPGAYNPQTQLYEPKKDFDFAGFEFACRLWTVVLDISVSMAGFPAREFAEAARDYRTLGLGYANLGGLLARFGLRYDSDAGRALAAGVTALMTGIAYRTSAEMAEELGSFPRWEANADSMQDVLIKHRFAVGNLECADPGGNIIVRAWDIWKALGTGEPHRNAQATLLAPTGTIALVMDCETTGVEPFHSRSSIKRLAGGGTMAIEHNNVAEEDCAVPSRPGGPCLSPDAHVLMVAAVQPFLSGAVSKTINMPHDATVEDVDRVYRMAHQLGLKSVAIYRDGSKLTQPLETTKEKTIIRTEGDHPHFVFGSGVIPGIGHDTKLTQPLETTKSEAVIRAEDEVARWNKAAAIPIEKDNLTAFDARLGVKPFTTRMKPQTDASTSLRSLKWWVCESEVLRDPALTGEARKILTELAHVQFTQTDELKRGARRELPSRRPSASRVKLEVGGQSVYISTGDHEDGTLGEIFIGLSREGAHVRSMMECFSKSISIGLQYGVPLGVFVDAFIHTKFEPAGIVAGDTRVRICSSLPDLIVRHLAIEYLDRDDLASVPRTDDAEAVAEIAAHIAAGMERATHAAPTMVMVADACWECGNHGTLRRTGTCVTCEACGANSGCA